MIEAIRKRKSIREFDPKEVEIEKIERILKAAMRAPSAMAVQPWEFVVVDDKTLIDGMKGYSTGARPLDTAPLAIVVLEREGIKRRDMGITFFASQDLGACTENILLQAVEEGLGACWLAVSPGSQGQRQINEILNLPNGLSPYAVVAIGYPKEGVNLEPVDYYDENRIHYNKF